ncbi:DUF6879 family protein [Nocardia rhamnosiphila]|uniref:DUF6879 family protein n=1 Tax=Nocardia rhamnosiphila TaxID=426716 RepID=UPI0033EC80D3
MRLLEYAEGTALVAAAKSSAYHLELRDSYYTEQEVERLRLFRAGEPDPALEEWFEPWTRLVTGLIGRGVSMRRIRVVTEPLTEYSHWLHSITGFNVEAGEQVRWVGRHTTSPEELARDDWWLLDGALVVYSLFDSGEELSGFAVTDDPVIAAHCQRVWDVLWARGTDHRDYRPDVQR